MINDPIQLADLGGEEDTFVFILSHKINMTVEVDTLSRQHITSVS